MRFRVHGENGSIGDSEVATGERGGCGIVSREGIAIGSKVVVIERGGVDIGHGGDLECRVGRDQCGGLEKC